MKEKTYSLEESYEILDNLTKAFVPFLEHLMEILEVNRVNLVGVGNEVSAGFVNSSTPFTPWLDKLEPFIEAHNTGLDINIATYSLLKKNSNLRIYQFLNGNPTGMDVKDNMIDALRSQKAGYDLSILKDYPDQATSFSNMYGDDIFTITNFIGSTGEILQHLDKAALKSNRMKMFEKEMLYFSKILSKLIVQSEHSYITVSNVPTPTRYVPLVSSKIKKVNKEIEDKALAHLYTMFFDGFTHDLMQKDQNGKNKLSFIPDEEDQYQALCKYVEFLMQQLPILLMREEQNRDPMVLMRKYKGLDYDGKLEERINGQFLKSLSNLCKVAFFNGCFLI